MSLDYRSLMRRAPLYIVLYVINFPTNIENVGEVGIDKRTLKILDEVLIKMSDQGYKELYKNYKEWLAEIIFEANQSQEGGMAYIQDKIGEIRSELQYHYEGANRSNTQSWIMKLIREVQFKTPVGLFGISKKVHSERIEAEQLAASSIGIHRYA